MRFCFFSPTYYLQWVSFLFIFYLARTPDLRLAVNIMVILDPSFKIWVANKDVREEQRSPTNTIYFQNLENTYVIITSKNICCRLTRKYNNILWMAQVKSLEQFLLLPRTTSIFLLLNKIMSVFCSSIKWPAFPAQAKSLKRFLLRQNLSSVLC